jgi:Ca2+/H+ antiporter, TMEM165/GDT1 family
MDLAIVLTTFLLIVPVELPDKTFIATLVLATRYGPLASWIGVGLAFFVQTLVAVLAGGLIAQLPTRPVTAVAAATFAIGAVVLWRGAGHADAEEAQTEREFAGKVLALDTGRTTSVRRRILASFVVLFIAEWGDLSQLLTAGLVVRYDDPLSVFVGAWASLLLISAAGALLGRALLRRVRLGTVQRVGGGVCGLLAVLAVLSVLGVETPF